MFLLLVGAGAAGENDAGPDRNRFPFTAEELRAGCRPGRVSTSLTRVTTPGGKTRTTETFRCVQADDKGGTFEYQHRDKAGKPTGKPRRERKTWAAFAAELARDEKQVRTVEERTITGAGTFDCRVYIVAVSPTKQARYYYAKDLPGPAVRVEVQKEGEHVLFVEMIRHRDGDEAALLRLLGAKGVAGATAKKRARLEAAFTGIASGRPALRPTLDGVVPGAKDDGVISPGELEMAHPPSGAGTGGLFRSMDRDRDGKVTKDEYLEHYILPEEAHTAFKRLEADGNRYVSKKEFLDRCGIPDPDDASRTFRRMDLNGDGVLNRSEFVRAWIAWWR